MSFALADLLGFRRNANALRDIQFAALHNQWHAMHVRSPYSCGILGNSWFLPNHDSECQDAVEGRARFARPNIPRPSKAIGEYSE